MPDKSGKPFLRETRKKAEELGILTPTNARQRKAQLEASVAAHPISQYEALKETLTLEVSRDA